MKSKMVVAMAALTSMLLLAGCVGDGYYYGGAVWDGPGYYDPYYDGPYYSRYRTSGNRDYYRNNRRYVHRDIRPRPPRHGVRPSETRPDRVRPSQQRPRPTATAPGANRPSLGRLNRVRPTEQRPRQNAATRNANRTTPPSVQRSYQNRQAQGMSGTRVMPQQNNRR